MSKHTPTPGPWKYCPQQGFVISLAEEVDENIVCDVAGSDGSTLPAQQDAHLIAAAPELLNLAELVVDLDTPEDMVELHDMAVKLIAKIRGEE